MYYLADYMVKSPLEIASYLSLAPTAHNHIRRFPSIADDTGTASRTEQYLFNRMINSINGSSAVSLQTASAALLGLPSTGCSHDNAFVVVWHVISYLKNQRQELSGS